MRVLQLILMALLLANLHAATLGAEEIALPKTEEERQKLTGREINILRRQMRDREDTAAAAFKNAETAFLVGEYDRAIEEFLLVSREYEDTSYRMRSVLRVGDVYYRQKRYDRAVAYYQRSLNIPSELWWPEEVIEDYARADYMIGVCYYDQKALNRAFAHFRRFVQRFPDSRFADRAWDFIGRGNMEMKRYGQAIDAFRMVGTANIGREGRRTVSPGEELYVRVNDADVGMATRHSTIPVRLKTSSGDEEILDLGSLGLGSPIFLGTIRTRLGAPRLTRALDESFTLDIRRQIDAWIQAAEDMDGEAAGVETELAALKPPQIRRAEIEGMTEEQVAAYRAEVAEKHEAGKKRLTERIEHLKRTAETLRRQAFRELETSFARIEAVLEEWQVEQEYLKQDEEKATDDTQPAAQTTARDGGQVGGEEQEMPVITDVFTPEQIAETRLAIRETPTTKVNHRFRRALLEFWHNQLIQEYKTLDLKGNDTIAVEYLDAHGETGTGVSRSDMLGVASDAAIFCIGHDMHNVVRAVILGDCVRIKVVDPDMSTTDKLDTLEVVVSSIEKTPADKSLIEDEAPEQEDTITAPAKEESATVDVFALNDEEEEMPQLVLEGSPHFTLRLTETEPHSGEFVGMFATMPAPGAPEAVVSIGADRIVRAAYLDKRTAGRNGEWVVATQIEMIPASDGMHEVIEMQESQLDRRSELEKGIALGKLGRVYQDLGLRLEASRAFDEALKIVKRIVDAERGSPLGEEATYQMWDLYFASGDEEAAAEACRRLIAAFPNSPLVPDALLIMAKAERRDLNTAISYLNRLVTRYGDSSLAPEAQYMIADLRSQAGTFDVSAFEATANKFPDSNFAAQSLLRLAEYYIDNRDFLRARDYLERITLDFPDFDRLDRVTYMRGICAYRVGDIQLAYTLMHETIEKYPGTSAARSAGRIVGLLASRLKQ